MAYQDFVTIGHVTSQVIALRSVFHSLKGDVINLNTLQVVKRYKQPMLDYCNEIIAILNEVETDDN